MFFLGGNTCKRFGKIGENTWFPWKCWTPSPGQTISVSAHGLLVYVAADPAQFLVGYPSHIMFNANSVRFHVKLRIWIDVQLGWDKIKVPTDPQSWETLKRGTLLFKPLDCRVLRQPHQFFDVFLGLKITKFCGTWWFKNFLGYDELARFFRWKITELWMVVVNGQDHEGI